LAGREEFGIVGSWGDDGMGLGRMSWCCAGGGGWVG